MAPLRRTRTRVRMRPATRTPAAFEVRNLIGASCKLRFMRERKLLRNNLNTVNNCLWTKYFSIEKFSSLGPGAWRLRPASLDTFARAPKDATNFFSLHCHQLHFRWRSDGADSNFLYFVGALEEAGAAPSCCSYDLTILSIFQINALGSRRAEGLGAGCRSGVVYSRKLPSLCLSQLLCFVFNKV